MKPSRKEIQEVIKKARPSLSPWPSGVYKIAQSYSTDFWRSWRSYWGSGSVWNSLMGNMYIDNLVQKWVILMVLNKTGVVTQLFKKAQENKGNLVVLWVTSQTPMDPCPTSWLRRPCTGSTSQSSLETPFWTTTTVLVCNIWLVKAWDRNNHLMHHFSVYLHSPLTCWWSLQRSSAESPNQVWCVTAAYQGIHGWSQGDNITYPREQVDPEGTGGDDLWWRMGRSPTSSALLLGLPRHHIFLGNQ